MGLSHKNSGKRLEERLDKLVRLISLLSQKKCSVRDLCQETGFCEKTIYRYLKIFSLYFQVIEDLEGPGTSNRSVFYLEKGRGRITNIL